MAIAFKCSVFNIGVEGQLVVGGMAAAITGAFIELPPGIHQVVVLGSSILAGMLWAFIPALLKFKMNVSVVISTIMTNYIGLFLVQYLINGPFRGNTNAQATPPILKSAVLLSILPKPLQLNLGFLIMFLVMILVYILMNKTSLGYEMKAVGFNPIASETQGIDVKRNMFLALLISGGIAGLAGGIEISGTLGKIFNGFSTGYGFSGIPIALISRSNPFAILLTGFFFGMMRTGSFLMQSMVGVSRDIVGLIQGLLIVFISMENAIRYFLNRKKK